MKNFVITDHPFLDKNGPSYRMGPCSHKNCAPKVAHQCPHAFCGKYWHEHEYRIEASGPKRMGRRIVKNN